MGISYKLGPPYPWMTGSSFEFEGTTLLLSDEPIRVGDTYIAGRNTGPHLLTCRSVHETFICSVENAYAFDTCECRKIVGIE